MFDYNGPLGSFSSRINLAYAIGKLPASFRSDLTNIRNIRNKFAHRASEMSFETPDVHSIIKKLKFHPHPVTERPRRIFVTVTLGLMGFLDQEVKAEDRFKIFPEMDFGKISDNHKVLIENFETRFGTSSKS